MPCAALALAGAVAPLPLGKWEMDESRLFSAPDRSSRLVTIESVTSTRFLGLRRCCERAVFLATLELVKGTGPGVHGYELLEAPPAH